MSHSRSRTVSAALALPALAAISLAASWLDGYDAYRSRDYRRALAAFQAAASDGDAKAMNYLGQMYASGQGVVASPAEAARWFASAAEKGDPGGQNNLGEMYANGWGVSRNFELAARWFKAAADSGDAQAQFNLGKLYASGLGVERKPAAAAELFRKALKSDPKSDKARNWLGAAYYDLGDHASAAEQFKALAQSGARPEEVWHYYLGMSLFKLDRLDEAQAAFQMGLNDPPSSNRGQDRRQEMQDRLAAIQSYKDRFRKAEAHLANRDPAAAKKEFMAAQAALRTVEVGERLAALDAAGAGGSGLLSWALAVGLPLLGLGGVGLYRRGKSRPEGARPAEPSAVAPGTAQAEALAESGEAEEGLRALEGVARAAWGSREYRVALRL